MVFGIMVQLVFNYHMTVGEHVSNHQAEAHAEK
jgi:hypothetical protein